MAVCYTQYTIAHIPIIHTSPMHTMMMPKWTVKYLYTEISLPVENPGNLDSMQKHLSQDLLVAFKQ